MLLCVCRVDTETNKRLELERSIRDLENRIEELNEDLDAEKASRSKAEKQKKEISEVCPFYFRFCNQSCNVHWPLASTF